MKTKLIMLAVFSLIAACIVIVAVELNDFRKNNPAVYVLTGMDPSTDTTAVQFKIGETTLRVPQNYFQILPKRGPFYGKAGRLHKGPDQNQISFSMQLLLPNYEPRTEANSARFDTIPPQDTISLLVESNSPSATGIKSFQIFYQKRKGDVSEGPSGFNKFAASGIATAFFEGTVDNPKDFVLCHGLETAPRPSCDRYIQIAPRMVVKYNFPSKYLPDVENMDQRLIDILNSFKIDGPAFSFID